METTARRALSELIDQLLVPGADEPVSAVVPAQARPASPVVERVAPQPVAAAPLAEPADLVEPVRAPEPPPVLAVDDVAGLAQYGIEVQADHPVRPVPAQRPAEPPSLPSVPQAVTVLPGGARSAIMWRSR